VSYAGLIRGAIAYALTYRIDRSMLKHDNDLYIIRENTLLIVVFSTVVFGSMMPLFAKLLGIKVEKQSIDTQVFNRFRNLSIASLDELLIDENKLSFEHL
jgi:NhaP-type Na+/H+ or K+/H+ antiporter